MRQHVALYVHHHGRGHISRARSIIEALEVPATVLTSADAADSAFGGADVIRLEPDTDPSETSVRREPPPTLHYAPIGVAGLRERMASITRFLADVAPAVLVVDVSVEVAQLAHIVGVPTVIVRQHGARWDPAHLAAYEGAEGLLAPFGPALEEPDVPRSVREATFYAGGLGRRPGSRPDRTEARRRLGWRPKERVVALLRGSGGSGPDPPAVASAARATPDHQWVVVGPWPQTDGDVRATGWVDDPLEYLAASDVVVGSAGHNTIMEAAAVARPLVCIPQDRPFDEQRRKADRLRDRDVAEVLDRWAPPDAWPEILQRAERRGAGSLAALADPRAAGRVAGYLTDLVQRFSS